MLLHSTTRSLDVHEDDAALVVPDRVPPVKPGSLFRDLIRLVFDQAAQAGPQQRLLKAAQGLSAPHREAEKAVATGGHRVADDPRKQGDSRVVVEKEVRSDDQVEAPCCCSSNLATYK